MRKTNEWLTAPDPSSTQVVDLPGINDDPPSISPSSPITTALRSSPMTPTSDGPPGAGLRSTSIINVGSPPSDVIPDPLHQHSALSTSAPLQSPHGSSSDPDPDETCLLFSPLAAIGAGDPTNHPSPQHPSTCLSRDSTFDAKKKTEINIGLWNAWSVCNKAEDACAMIEDRDLDIVCITETWLHEEGDDSIKSDLKPTGYEMLDSPRGKRGGGIALLYRSHLKIRSLKVRSFVMFENMEFTFTCGKQTIRLILVYRPGPSDENLFTVNGFLKEFDNFLSCNDIPYENVLLLGDFNFHVDDPDNKDACKFIQLYTSHGFCQSVCGPTQKFGHTLDLVLTRSGSLVRSVVVENVHLSDHYLVTVGTDMSRPRVPRVTVKGRNLKDIDLAQLRNDLLSSNLVSNPPTDVDELANAYNTTLANLLDMHAPEVERTVPNRTTSEWFNEDVQRSKQLRRQAERRKRKSGLVGDIVAYHIARNKATKTVRLAKLNHYQSEFEKHS